MRTVWLFLHFVGFVLWIGGGAGAMVAGLSARKESRAMLGAVARAQAMVHRVAIAPGALLVVLSGLLLTMGMMGPTATSLPVSLLVMQGAGVLGALIVLFITLPMALRLGRTEPEGPSAAYFDQLRSRQKLLSSVAGTLALIALIAAAIHGG